MEKIKPRPKVQVIIEKIIFSYTRWILIPFYLVLILALIIYALFDLSAFFEYIIHIKSFGKSDAMITFIELIDMAMIANLGKMIISGSFNSFISKSHGYKNENISSGMLKVKMASSIIGVTSIGLLQKSVNISTNKSVDWETLKKLAFLHSIFLIGAMVLEIVEYLHTKSDILSSRFEMELEKHEFEIKQNSIY